MLSSLLLGVFLQVQPNIVIVNWDDAGIETFKNTQAFQQLSLDGKQLKVHYSNSLCTPGRGTLLTGRYVERDRISRKVYHPDSGSSAYLPSSLISFASLLHSSGYATGYFGKYHVGLDNPSVLGYDKVVYHKYAISEPLESSIPWYDENENLLLTYPKTSPLFKQIARQTFEPAISWISQQAGPFLAHINPDSVHTPYQCEHKGSNEQLWQCVTREAGDWLSVLRSALPENTVLIVTSDNGAANLAQHWNGSLRGGKDDNWEGSYRVPAWVVWPGFIQAGTQSDVPTAMWDWFPTLLEVAGIPIPTDREYDGESLLPLLLDQGTRNGQTFWWDKAYREGCFKWSKANNVWNLCLDPNEASPLNNPTLTASMKAKWKAATPVADQ